MTDLTPTDVPPEDGQAEPGSEVSAPDALGEPMPASDVMALLSESPEGAAAVAAFPDFAREVPFAQAEVRAILGGMEAPERDALMGAFEALSDAEQVRVMMAMAGRGRMNALEPGDPATISQARNATMNEADQDKFDEAVDEIRAKKREAASQGNYKKANRLSEKERQMYEARDGAGPPIGPGAPIGGPGGRGL